MPAPHRPPVTDPLVAMADRCVQCGLCLPACPTYGRDRIEAESPRGRIALTRAWALESLEPTGRGDLHLDQCLACRSCEAVCPAGVPFGALLVQARGRQRERRPASRVQRLVESLVAHARLLSVLFSAYRHVFRFVPERLRVLPRPPALTEAHVATRMEDSRTQETVDLFVGCVARSYESAARVALEQLCNAAGVRLRVPATQGCCGAIAAHAGDLAGAASLASINRKAFGHATTVVTLATGCHESVADALPTITATDAIDFIAARIDRLHWRASEEHIALHLPCSQRNVVRSVPALRRLLAAVPGLRITELDAGFGCCGAAGMQMVTDAERAAGFRAPLIAQFEQSGASRLLSANLGCRLHLQNATSRPVQHPLEFLASRLAGRDAGGVAID